MNGRPLIRRAVRAMQRGQPVPVDVARWLVPVLESAVERSGERFEVVAGLRLSDEVRQLQREHLAAAAALLPAHLKISDCICHVRRAAEGLEPLLLADDAEERIHRRWRVEVLHAIRLADLPGYTTLNAIFKSARSEENARYGIASEN